jgi:uncharacterized protein (DUF433 family)
MTLKIEAHPVPLRIDEHGVARVGKTRVTLDTVVYAFNQGESAEEIMQNYPSLRLADVYGVIAYYLEHQREIDSYLHQRKQEAEELRKEIEARFDQRGVRERLLARRQDPYNEARSA